MSRMSATDCPDSPAPGAARDAVPAAAGPLEGAVWSLIGNTPLVRLRRIEPHPGVEIHAKLESRNPGGSVKDRAAASMIREGLRTRRAGAGQDAARRHVRATPASPTRCSAPRWAIRSSCACRRTSRASASACSTSTAPTSSGPTRWKDPTAPSARRAAVRARARALLLSGPVQQRRQLAGALRHDRRRDPRADRGGASRTSSPASAPAARSWARAAGCARRSPRCELISVQPDSPFHGLEGLKHMESAIVPPIYDPALADEGSARRTDEAPGRWCAGWRARRALRRRLGAAALVARARRRLHRARRDRHHHSRRRRALPVGGDALGG